LTDPIAAVRLMPRMRVGLLVSVLVLSSGAMLAGTRDQSATPPAMQRAPDAAAPSTPEQVRAAIDEFGNLDFTTRTRAARTVRRAAPEIAVPTLTQAVEKHADGYVKFRALVLLSGFNDPRTRDVMAKALTDPNDRLRSVAYTYFEHHTDPAILPKLIDALSREESEFVRPALTRALAAYRDDPKAKDAMIGLVMKGQAFFRSAVIEAVGDYRATQTVPVLTEVAKTDGPLQDDAAVALGKIGEKTALPVLAQLQRSAPRESQPSIAAAICLLGINCESHQAYIARSLQFSIATIGYQDLLRSSANALEALAVSGREPALVELIAQGAPTRDPARAAIALAVGTVALRNTAVLLKVFEREGTIESAIELLREAFDMLEEDYEEERFFVTVRRAYWQAPPGSPARKVAEALVLKLEF
jgi:HEAT repeat protein